MKGGSVDATVNLDAEGTANCYIVPTPGKYRFKADVKGSSNVSLDGTATYAEVIWESFGTDIAPSVGDIIKSVRIEDGSVFFETPDALQNGNALIAVKDNSGTILWSWHIWVCDGYNPIVTAQTYANNAGIMMDRNIGALSATPGSDLSSGLLYQWGRKDPFMASSSLSNPALAKTTPDMPTPVSGPQSIEYTIQHPDTVISFGSFEWDSSANESRWDEVKTIYDPCPARLGIRQLGRVAGPM